MSAISSIVVSAFQANSITKDLVLQATRHLDFTKKKNLFSRNSLARANATGYLYESVIYEMIIRAALESEEISWFVLRREDVPKASRAISPSLGQNGFYYSRAGEIIVRGDGMDLGEFDSILLDRNHNVLCVEAMVTKNYIKGLFKEIGYKSYLLSKLFGRRPSFVVVSPDDIAETSVGQRLIDAEECRVAKTAGFGKSLSELSQDELQNYRPEPTDISKGIFARQLPVTKTFSYKRIHNETRARLIAAIASDPKKEQTESARADPLLARIIIGQLNRDAIRTLTDKWSLTVNGSTIDPEIILQRNYRIMLVLGLPELRPGLYFKSKHPPAFAKFGPFKIEVFGCERVIFRWSTPFFFALENIRETVSTEMLEKIMKYCLNDNVIGPSVKRRRSEEVAVIWNLFGLKW